MPTALENAMRGVERNFFATEPAFSALARNQLPNWWVLNLASCRQLYAIIRGS